MRCAIGHGNAAMLGQGERRSVPSPLVGEGQGGGEPLTSKEVVPPTPNPSPQGGGESARCLFPAHLPKPA